jgi:nickel/cobalt transporter (NiCoT) family protein
MTYALSAVVLTIAVVTSYETVTSSEILPDLTGPVLAITIILVSFGSAYLTRKRQVVNLDDVSPVSPPTKDKSDTGKDDVTK